MAEEGLTMTANLLLLTSQLVHARYVVLEAEGEIVPRIAKPKKGKNAEGCCEIDEGAGREVCRQREVGVRRSGQGRALRVVAKTARSTNLTPRRPTRGRPTT